MQKKLRKRWIVLIAIAVILLITIIWTLWGNTALELNKITIRSNEIPAAFSGYRIAQVSDLHNAEFGEANKNLLAMLQEAAPDIIVITGDMIDSSHTNINVAVQFTKEVVKIAPCYYVTGNHESRTNEYEKLETGLMDAGVVVLWSQLEG